MREAIGAAGFDDTIMIPAGTYTLTLGLELTIDSRVTLIGAGEATTIIEADILPGVAGFRVFNIADVVVDIAEVTIRHGNVPGDSGGGILNQGVLTLTDTTISDNSASRGGGISSDNVLNGVNLTVSGNTSTFGGGGIESTGDLTLTATTIVNNATSISGGGGGINQSGISANLTLTNTTISDNTAAIGGGLSQSTGGLVNVIMGSVISVISGNTANALGAGGISTGVGTVTFTNSTISGNTATSGDGGGGIMSTGGQTDFKNTIIADNANTDCQGAGLNSLGNNLDRNNTCNLTEPTDLVGVDPLLSPLQDNGGPTETHALLAGSPAIDAGDDLAAPGTDQRGLTRPQGDASDIGAYEFQPVFTLSLDLGYTAGTATVEVTAGTLVAATRNIWGTFQDKVVNLESTAIPVTDPPATTVVFSAAVPAQGVVAVFATLTTPAGGIICSDFETLDTGPAP